MREKNLPREQADERRPIARGSARTRTELGRQPRRTLGESFRKKIETDRCHCRVASSMNSHPHSSKVPLPFFLFTNLAQ